MNHDQSIRRIQTAASFTAILIGVALLIGAGVQLLSTTFSPWADSRQPGSHSDQRPSQADDSAAADSAGFIPDEADGVVPEHTSVFDDSLPGVTNLNPELLTALWAAASDASADGIEMHINTGWRSAEYQQYLLDEAVAQYGSAEEAARWVATPEASSHVSGDAVDVGDADAAAWLDRRGSGYGLCRVYANEAWHFELRPNAVVSGGCPALYADATKDPRMG